MQDLLQPIQNSLQQLVGKTDLQQTATNFWQTLGYKSNKVIAMSWADIQAQTPSPTQAEQEAMPFVQETCMVFQVTEAEMSAKVSMFATNEYDKNEPKSYLFVAIRLEAKEYKRETLTTLTRLINKPFGMPVIVLFSYAGKVSIGVINRRLNKTDESKDVLKKVTIIKDIDAQSPHRAHLDILQDLALPTLHAKYAPKNFNDLHEAWRKTLDTKELNKRFFQEIANWYFWASATARFPFEYLKKYPENVGKTDAVLQKEANQIAIIRMITRLVFVWFIKEKGLVNPALFHTNYLQDVLRDFEAEATEKSTYYKAILQNLFFATLNKPIEKRTFVQNDSAGKKDNKNGVYDVYRYKRYFQNQDEQHIKAVFGATPFLNGGLFECLDEGNDKNEKIDCFTNAEQREKWLVVPNELFFRDLPATAENKQEPNEAIQKILADAYQTKNKKFDFVHGIIRTLEKYKFTVEENTPLETETALDPELLGKIFESLLAYFNPETEEAARKTTGSFYTPRDVVDYMVEETLLAYLKAKVVGYFEVREGFTDEDYKYTPVLQPASSATLMIDNPKLTKEQREEVEAILKKIEQDLRHLLAYQTAGNPLKEQETKLLIEAIYNLKILDPACGSGAFPMGVLHKLVFVLNKLDRENQYIQPIIKQKKQEAYNQKIALLAEKYLPKKQELQANREIIAQITIEELRKKNEKEINDLLESIEKEHSEELAKLEGEFDIRLNEYDYAKKLYLIQNCIYGVDIQPVATQIAKLRFFITLVIEQKIEKEAENYGIEPLPNLETKIVAANALLQLDEPETDMIKSDIELKRKEIEAQRKEYFLAQTKDKKKTIEAKEAQLREKLRQAIEDELQKKIDNEKAEIEKLEANIHTQKAIKVFKDKHREERVKNAIADSEKLIRQARKRIETHEKGKITAYHLANWNPYNPDVKADFFNPAWIFGLEGFDLILGNPPYVQIQKLKREQQTGFEAQKYDTYTRMGDLYSLFYERSFKLLAKNGFLCFITSNKWMRANYGESTRQFFAEHTSPTLLVDFGSVQVFETATVDTNILILQNKPKPDKTNLLAARINKDFDLEEGIQKTVSQNAYKLASLNANAWIVGEAKDTFDIKGKVEAQGIALNATDEAGKKIWDITINRGIVTGLNDAFVIDEATKNDLINEHPESEKILKPVLKSGRNIEKWYPNVEKSWLIGTFPALKLNIDDYPSIKKYLLSKFGKDKLAQDGEGRKKTGNKWFETQDQIAYWSEFEKPKIIYLDITKFFPFVYDESSHFYTLDRFFIMTGEHLGYLTCFFNSKLFYYCFADNFPELQGGSRKLQKIFFEKIPVKPVGEAEAGVFARLVEYLVFLKQQKLENQYDQFMPSFFEQISEALIFELYFPAEFANSGLSVMQHLYDLPALPAESPLIALRKIYVEYYQDTHPVRQAVYYMGAVLPVQLVQSALL